MPNFPLTTEYLMQQTPALFTQEPHHEASDKYYFVSTIDIINEIKSFDWYPTSVQQSSVKDEN